MCSCEKKRKSVKRKILQRKKLTGYLVLAISEKDSRNPRSRHLEKGAVTASQVAQKYVNEFKKWNGESHDLGRTGEWEDAFGGVHRE